MTEKKQDPTELYDVIIIGGGAAGLTAAIYAGRARLKTLVLERGLVGGLITSTNSLENYPGWPRPVGGEELMNLFYEQAKVFGTKFKFTAVKNVDFTGKEKIIHTFRNTYRSKTVIIATGAKPRPLGCHGEAELIGKGISFCSTCDADNCIGKDVFVVGGGDSAVEEAMYLTRFADRVTVIHRRDALRACKAVQERAFATPKLSFLWDSVIYEVQGQDKVEALIVENVKNKTRKTLTPRAGHSDFIVFPFVGLKPATDLFEGKIDMEKGFINTDTDMHTSLPGVFAAGDCCVKNWRQVITAAADGAIAGCEADKYLQEY